jgi:uncharacterized protein YvpB
MRRMGRASSVGLKRSAVTVSLLAVVGLLGAEPSFAADVADAAAPVVQQATPVAVSPTAAPQLVSTTSTSSTSAAVATSRLLQVPLYPQSRALSCEAASLRMALAFEGIFVSEDQVLAMIPTDLQPASYDSAGLRWGDPYTSFVGQVTGSQVDLSGYGTYYPTIAAAASSLGGTVLAAGEGIGPSSVYSAVLGGHPVIAWVTYQWAAASRSDYVAYDGRTIPYAGAVEHAVTVTGVTATDVYVNNPDTGAEVVPKAVFEASYATFNDMAVFLK